MQSHHHHQHHAKGRDGLTVTPLPPTSNNPNTPTHQNRPTPKQHFPSQNNSTGFDPMRTTEDVILSTFSATAAVQRVLMRKNFCFIRFNRYVQYSTLQYGTVDRTVDFGAVQQCNCPSGSPLLFDEFLTNHAVFLSLSDGCKCFCCFKPP